MRTAGDKYLTFVLLISLLLLIRYILLIPSGHPLEELVRTNLREIKR